MILRPARLDTAVKLALPPKPVGDNENTDIQFERIEQVSCSYCGSFVTLTEARPLSSIPCPHCGGKVFVAVRLANFLVHGNSGQGETGSIYRATDETLARDVAIKLLRGSYVGDPDACDRLRKEACALGKFNHPRVAQVYALSFSKGNPYLVMEWVTGEDFAKKVQDEGHLSERVVLRMAVDVAEGLQALNREGLVHSDIKPANIVMDRDGNSKLVDFGLTGMSRYDNNHNLMGTPDYIAPELIFGEKDSPSSDIYSFGATLYHLLAGCPPTSGEDAAEVLKARISKVPITPLGEVAPHVSPATCKMVMKMLEHQPEDRLQNSDILASEVKESIRLLDASQEGQPGVASEKAPDVLSPSERHKEAYMTTDEAKANARGALDSFVELPSPTSSLAQPPSQLPPPPQPPSVSPSPPPSPKEAKSTHPAKKSRGVLWVLLMIMGALAVAVQYPPCDKVWDMCCYHVSIYIDDVAKRQPVVDHVLKWSKQKMDELKGFVAAKFVTPLPEPASLLPLLAAFTNEEKLVWHITNIGAQTKSGSAMQTGGALIIQLSGVAVDNWASWRNGYNYGRFIWSKVTTDHYAFSARIVSMATHDSREVTGIQIKGTDASTCPWVLFGFLGNGELFLQIRNPDSKAIIIRHVKQPDRTARRLMIVRRGSLFEALYSSDGISWTPFGRCSLALPSEHTVGFTISMLDPNRLDVVKFDTLSLKLPRWENSTCF